MLTPKQFHMRAIALATSVSAGDHCVVMKVPYGAGDCEYQSTGNLKWSTIGNLLGMIVQIPKAEEIDACNCKDCRDAQLLHEVVKLAFKAAIQRNEG